ncbi:platelet-derived growth factor receptor alpha isoform X4 [Tribolium castaneum]|uniref:platelet-derived growth factor receptor alpha isoform X4 n=1 Tax=Tribolium castaneum TaxID=7070 RepID=UPI00077DD2E6|nr:PREDICTED: platelet-derived growth factor receptor alpha isoform X3 [Tribolium castaneum]|eukprot:XP_015838685.1 PREDICTED: platelet-derived growth factor receptor alpha isoform X3 [Tribolium castaneum]
MCLLKVIFVMVMVNQLEAIQNKATADNTSATEIINNNTSAPALECDALKATGCLDGTNLNLSLTYWHPTKKPMKWLVNTVGSNSYCNQARIINNFLIVDTSYINSSCIYNISTIEPDVPHFLIKDSSFKEMDVANCPKKTEFCVSVGDTFSTSLGEKCPYLHNYSINAMVNNRTNIPYIYLNVSLDLVDANSDKIEIHVKSRHRNSCGFMYDNFHDADHEIIIPKALPVSDITPECELEILMSFPNADSCTVSYKVPEIPGFCYEMLNPTSKILSVEPLYDNQFKILWDPGTKARNNQSYYLKKVNFFYLATETPSMPSEVEFVGKPDLEAHTATVVMKLFENDNYTLQGIFTNNYTCLHQAEFYFTAPPRRSLHLVFFTLLTSVLVVMTFLHKRILRYAKKLLGLVIPRYRNITHRENFDLQPLQSGNLVHMSINTQYTPIEFLRGDFDEFEFPRNKIIIKEILGTGAFGRVYSAKALGIGGSEGYQMVAVKTLGEGEQITREAADDFKSEIEIFKKIGKHPNIVSLLGCCTVEAPCMMIMELVPCGDLKKYLVELREQWFAEKNKQVFFPPENDNSDGAYIEPSSPTSVNSITTSRLPSTSETVFTNLEDPMTPLLEHNQQALQKVLDHKELQNFALQIARGMAHLEKISITHRDLAARNILINEFKTLKISDFGLSRTGVYINQRTKKLPLRWMALEAITEQKYDSRSDVWSFGVVLWEIGTLGAFPYEKVPDSMILHFLQMGRRLERPEICTDELYSLMRQCWATDPSQRPTFRELESALDVKAKKVYVNFDQLNPSYVFPPSDARVVKGVPIVINPRIIQEEEEGT